MDRTVPEMLHTNAQWIIPAASAQWAGPGIVAKLAGMIRLLCLLLLLFLPSSPAQSLPGFADFLEQQRVAWRIPGLAVAVVRNDRVVHQSTHGTTDGEKKSPITPETLFGIGSVTKSMTVTVLQTLAEEGKLDWDRPVRDYAPDFRLSDPAITEQATVRDLVSHRTGLPRHDALWFRSGATASSYSRSFDFSTSAPACARSINTTT